MYSLYIRGRMTLEFRSKKTHCRCQMDNCHRGAMNEQEKVTSTHSPTDTHIHNVRARAPPHGRVQVKVWTHASSVHVGCGGPRRRSRNTRHWIHAGPLIRLDEHLASCWFIPLFTLFYFEEGWVRRFEGSVSWRYRRRGIFRPIAFHLSDSTWTYLVLIAAVRRYAVMLVNWVLR